jgi:hypothetical protein
MTTSEPGRGRVIALRVVAAIFVLIVLVALNVTMILPWIAWLPEKTLLSIGMSPEEVPNFLVQGTAIQINYTVLMVSVALQPRRPAANVAALWLVILFMGSTMVLDTVQRDIGDPIWYVMYALFVAIVALHPRRLAPLRPIDPVAATVAVIGAVPLAWFAFEELRQQFAPGGPAGQLPLRDGPGYGARLVGRGDRLDRPARAVDRGSRGNGDAGLGRGLLDRAPVGHLGAVDPMGVVRDRLGADSTGGESPPSVRSTPRAGPGDGGY